MALCTCLRGHIDELCSVHGSNAQPLPTVVDRKFIQDLVIEDIEKRKAYGLAKYGTLLQAGNGRDALTDLYEEMLDGVMYLRQMIEERDA